MQLAMKIIWIIICLWMLKFPFCLLEGFKKCPFLKLNCELMEKEQDFIFGLEKVQTV